MAKKTFSFSQPSPLKPKPAAKLEVLSNDVNPLDGLKNDFTSALIEKIKAVYATEKWKYSLIKKAKENYDFDLQYIQLTNFEKGKNASSKIIYLMLAEINKFDEKTVIKIDEQGVKI